MPEEKQRVWYDLKEIKSESDDFLAEDLENKVLSLKKLNPGEFLVVEQIKANENTNYFLDYIDELKYEGLDIGKGDAEYGYKMPLPEKKEKYRELIVFRRRK